MAQVDPSKYTVYVGDNFHYMDKDERYTAGIYWGGTKLRRGAP